MTHRNTDTSPLVYARAAGVLYLIIIVAGIFAEFVVRGSLVVQGDAATTAGNIVTSEGLFRIGIAGDLIMILCDVALAMLFYVLLKPVNNPLALLASFFRLAQAATLGVNLLNLFFVLELSGGADYLSIFRAGQLNALVMVFLNAHGIGYSIALVFFALSILVLGYLVYKSGYLPRILGVLLVIASLGYLVDSYAKVLMLDYAKHEGMFALVVFVPAFIAELAFCLWLLLKGVDVEKWNDRVSATQRR